MESCPVGDHGSIMVRSYALHSVDDGAMPDISQRGSSGNVSLFCMSDIHFTSCPSKFCKHDQ